MNTSKVVFNFINQYENAHRICKPCLERKPKHIHYNGFMMAGKLLCFNGKCDVCKNETTIALIEMVK